MNPYRGQVWWVETEFGRKPWLVVSNNRINQRRRRTVIAARMTTTMKFQDLPEVVGLSSQDQMTGVVLCGTLAEIDKEDLLQNAGALSRETMRRVDAALAFTFGLSVGT